MSERKVLSKYYPPDFDPAAITRTRAPKSTGPKVIPVRLMAPFGMKCTYCGEYIYKGRKFNARKETTDERYYSIPIYRFYIRCTRCSGEITFKTDPKNMDYESEKGAKRNFEMWRQGDDKEREETEEERLDRLEQEELEKDAMGVLEGKVVDAKMEMEIADKLDEIRTRNARVERKEKLGDEVVVASVVDERDKIREQQEKHDEEIARRAFMTEEGEKIKRLVEESDEDDVKVKLEVAIDKGKGKEREELDKVAMPPPPSFKRGVKRKKDFGAMLGIKKKPALV
ncbi:hypothetical protein MMC25_004169 [Agyrium rufum]|nr:hypothetical protein [Agyrium rufum]